MLNNNNDNNKRMDRMMGLLENMITLQTQQVAIAQQGTSIEIDGKRFVRATIDHIDQELGRKIHARDRGRRRY